MSRSTKSWNTKEQLSWRRHSSGEGERGSLSLFGNYFGGSLHAPRQSVFLRSHISSLEHRNCLVKCHKKNRFPLASFNYSLTAARLLEQTIMKWREFLFPRGQVVARNEFSIISHFWPRVFPAWIGIYPGDPINYVPHKFLVVHRIEFARFKCTFVCLQHFFCTAIYRRCSRPYVVATAPKKVLFQNSGLRVLIKRPYYVSTVIRFLFGKMLILSAG